MLFRRLMMTPRFFFAEAPQSIAGTPSVTQDTSHPQSPTPPQADTLVPSSRLHPKRSVCRLLQKI